MLRRLFTCTFILSLVVSAGAEPMRTNLTRENKLPGKGGMEAGLNYTYSDIGIETGTPGFEIDGDATEIVPYFRFGIVDDLAVEARVPFVSADIDGDSNSGLGDIAIDLELRAWEDIFGYPWILPYISYVSSSGNDDKNLGTGDSSWTVGASIGTTTYDELHWTLDAGYEFSGDYSNRASVGMGLLWSLSDEFALLGEVAWSEYSKFIGIVDENTSPIIWQVGFNYVISHVWDFSLYGGQETDGVRDAIAGGRLSASF